MKEYRIIGGELNLSNRYEGTLEGKGMTASTTVSNKVKRFIDIAADAIVFQFVGGKCTFDISTREGEVMVRPQYVSDGSNLEGELNALGYKVEEMEFLVITL